MFGSHLTFLIGPDVAEAFYRANDEVLSQPEVRSPVGETIALW